MEITKISKKEINQIIKGYLLPEKTGRKGKLEYWRIVKMILYRLKTGCQWRCLPVKMFCREKIIRWQTVYYYFNKWAKRGVWQTIFTNLLKVNKSKLDLSTIQLDGSHTIAKRGGEEVAYQGRKKAKTTNALFLVDNKGQVLGMSPLLAGHHNDAFEAEKMVDKIFQHLQAAELSLDGLFLNADAGFDTKILRNFCQSKGIIPNFDFNKRNKKQFDYQYIMDEELYKHRFVVERTNAWLDSFKALLVRFETRSSTWLALHYIAFCFLLLGG